MRNAHREIGLRSRRRRRPAPPAEHGVVVVVVLQAADEDQARPESGEEGAQVDADHHDDLNGERTDFANSG